eukprot:10436838-Alexandrium_andersonii.AAC.1
MDCAPSASARRRPNRWAAARSAQAERARARAYQHVLHDLAGLRAHRGSEPSVLGYALIRTLQQLQRGRPTAAHHDDQTNGQASSIQHFDIASEASSVYED